MFSDGGEEVEGANNENVLNLHTAEETTDTDKSSDSEDKPNETEISEIAKEVEKDTTTTTPKPAPAPTPTPAPAPAPTPTPTPTPTPVSPSGCPASTLSCVPCTTSSDSRCRVEPGETQGFLGWACQNNNPGNIRYSSARISYITKHGGPAPCGERVDSRGGTYMIFKTYADGRNSLKAYMKAINAGTHTAYSSCPGNGCTLAFVFSKYAPGDPNYASNIASKLGVSTSTTLSWVIANKFEALIDAIQAKEGFFTQ